MKLRVCSRELRIGYQVKVVKTINRRQDGKSKIEVAQNSQARKHGTRWDEAKECKAKAETKLKIRYSF